MSLKTPTTNSMHPRPIARRPGLPSTAPSDTPTVVTTAPPIVKILLTTDMPNPPSPPVVLADGGVHLSVQVGAGHTSGPFSREL